MSDTNIMVSGLTVYHRIPIQVIDALPSAVSSCPSHCCEIIAKFLGTITNTINPEQVLEQS